MSRELELEICCKDGSTIWTESRVTFLRKGGDLEILGVTRDISERKAAENKLHETKERLRGIFDSSPDAIVVTDLMGNILDCNPATARMHGYSEKEDLIGKNSFDFIAEEGQERAAENMELTLSEGSLRNVEYSQ